MSITLTSRLTTGLGIRNRSISKKRNNYEKSILLGAAITVSAATFADVGIGVSFQSNNDSTISIPYDLSDSVRIELSVRYYKTKEDGQFGYDYESYEIGVGWFHKKEAIKNMNLLMGARVGYIDSTQDFTDSPTLNGDGYFISPTLGFEYFIGDKFSIGGEVSLRYQKITRESINTLTSAKTSNDSTDIETDTSINARFYF